ncbi:hypothetical protein VNO77_26011 [Canavalia gladiata]|uniref:VQ domain-containing protein n=1 Tax=Canavalia gladiata TaxID=3824 RepID=A0AAN9Q5A3_CANGL
MLGVRNHVMKGKSRHSKRNCKKDIKVTYISSPMKVKTSASRFRELVQELTGQYSNVAEMFMEADADVHKDSTSQQWSTEDAYLAESNWFKPGFNELHNSRSSMEPLNEQFQYELLSFDML